jgi:hypothetical protein
MSQLDLAREQVFHAETQAALARAGKQPKAARERSRACSACGARTQQYTLPEHLPELPAAPAQLHDIERIALAQRLDVQAAKLDAQATAANLGLTRTTRFINVLDLGYVNGKSKPAMPTARGYELTLELPLFDWGGARVARAEAVYMQAVQRVAQAAPSSARSEARESYLGLPQRLRRAAHYRDTVIPLRKRISKRGPAALQRHAGQHPGTARRFARAGGRGQRYIDALKRILERPRQARGRARHARRHGGTRNTRNTQNDITQEFHLRRRRRHGRRRAGQQGRPGRHPRSPGPVVGRHRAAAAAAERPALQPGGHAERLEPALAHEGRRQGIPPGRRTRGARDRARHEGEPVGLQRPEPGADHRGGRGRPRAHLRHQQAAGSDQHPLARPDPAERDGRRGGPDPAADRARQDLSSTNSWRATPAPSCTTRTPTRWRRSAWA